MIKILKEKSTRREGNDCLICSNVALLEFSSSHFVVLSSEQACGGWTDNAIHTSEWSFKSRDEAATKYSQIEKGL